MKLVLFCSKHALHKWVYVKARRDALIMFRAWSNM